MLVTLFARHSYLHGPRTLIHRAMVHQTSSMQGLQVGSQAPTLAGSERPWQACLQSLACPTRGFGVNICARLEGDGERVVVRRLELRDGVEVAGDAPAQRVDALHVRHGAKYACGASPLSAALTRAMPE